jgi:hypothetical protein
MSSNIVNTVAYLKTSRNFPKEVEDLSYQMNLTYVDIANAVNVRTIGLFSVNLPAQTGEQWYINKNLKQQTLRKVYNFTTTVPINLGFKIDTIVSFTRAFGSFTDGTNWYGLIYGTNIAIAGQLEFYFKVNASSTTSDQIIFVPGAGMPTLSTTVSSFVVVEWLSNV